MKADEEVIYTDAPPDVELAFERGRQIADFLPPPDQLVLKKRKRKVTIMLNEDTIDFFKQTAHENQVKYQTMINNLLDAFVQYHRQNQ